MVRAAVISEVIQINNKFEELWSDSEDEDEENFIKEVREDIQEFWGEDSDAEIEYDIKCGICGVEDYEEL